MIKPDITGKVKTLPKFYELLTQLQVEAHGEEFISHHKILQKYASQKTVKVVKELGIGQGTTLAALAQCKPEKLIGIDYIDKHFVPYREIFERYCKRSKIEFEYNKVDCTTEESVSECDLLHIDTKHVNHIIIKELSLHAPYVNKFIIIPNTAEFKTSNGMLQGIAKYITAKDQSWQIAEHSPHGIGYTVLKRVRRKISHNENI